MPTPPEPDSPFAWLRAGVATLVMTLGGAGIYLLVVALKPVAAEFGASRSAVSLAYALNMVGFGLGGVVMGRLSDRIGVMWPAVMAAAGMGLGGLAVGNASSLVVFCIGHGLLLGFIGNAAVFAPLVADVTHWFERRRGLATAIVTCGSYLAGAVWPPIAQHWIDAVGWRQTYVGTGIACAAAMLLLSPVLHRPAPRAPRPPAGSPPRPERSLLGLRNTTVQCLVCAAGIGCCVAMAVPQAHIVAHVTDLGYPAADGAQILGLMLACGVLSRLAFGWAYDRLGVLHSALLGSGLQGVTLALFIPTQSLGGLYLVAAVFGLAQGGIVPAYAVLIRTYLPAADAGWRIGLALMFTLLGMALGGWMAGALYDLTGTYTAAFVNGIAFNVANLVVLGVLMYHARRAPSRAVLL